MGAKLASLSGVLGATQDRGLSFIASTTFSAASSVSIDSCFTAVYDNYRIIVDFSAASTSLTTTMRLRAAGADSSATSYRRQRHEASGATITASIATAATSWTLQPNAIDATTADRNRIAFDIYGPQLTRWTTGTYQTMVWDTGGTYLMQGGVIFEATTSFDGFSIIASTGNFSGSVRIYGYRNA